MRYVVKKKSTKLFDDDVDWQPINFKDITVYDTDDTVFTGIIDADGNPICRTDRVQAGFLAEILE
jgi:hypothetical protein